MFDFDKASGFIFDCDGTLLDSLGAWDIAERDLFAQAGDLTQEQEDELHASPFEEACRMFHERYGVWESTEAVFAHLNGYLLDFYRSAAEPLPGAVELVRTVHERGIPCAVVSSSPRRFLEAGLGRVGILDCFDCLVPTDEVGIAKTDPAIYRLAVERMGSDCATTWVVDDAPYAVAVVKRAGLNAIAPVNGQGAERRAQLEERADVVVETLAELLDVDKVRQ